MKRSVSTADDTDGKLVNNNRLTKMAMNIKENNDPSAYETTDNTNDDTKNINDYHPKIDAEHVQKIPKRVPYKSVTHRVQWGQNP